MDRYPYHEYTILLGATRTLAHIGVHFTHRVFGLSVMYEFVGSQRLWMMVSMVFRMTKYMERVYKYGTRFGKFRVMVGELDMES